MLTKRSLFVFVFYCKMKLTVLLISFLLSLSFSYVHTCMHKDVHMLIRIFGHSKMLLLGVFILPLHLEIFLHKIIHSKDCDSILPCLLTLRQQQDCICSLRSAYLGGLRNKQPTVSQYSWCKSLQGASRYFGRTAEYFGRR